MSKTKNPMPEAIYNRPILKKKIWKPCNRFDEHFVGGIVGREGSAKSYTALKIAEMCDPSFSVEQIFFDPIDFLEYLQDHEKDELRGKMFVGDEAGVGLGNRTWYEDEQVKTNQALQTVRDYNVGFIVTLPRLEELDLQTKGRLKGVFQMRDKDEERMVATARYLNIQPSRLDEGKIYKKYFRTKKDGNVVKIRRVEFRPPSDELVEEYSEQKQTFQRELYEDVVGGGNSEEESKNDRLKNIADEVARNQEEYMSQHRGNNKMYIDKDLIKMEHDLSRRDAKMVKKLAEQKTGIEPATA